MIADGGGKVVCIEARELRSLEARFGWQVGLVCKKNVTLCPTRQINVVRSTWFFDFSCLMKHVHLQLGGEQ